MPAYLVPTAQCLLVMLLPALLLVVPSEGPVRTVTLRHVPLSRIVNAVLATDGRIVAARADGGLVVSGRRDLITRALLPLGVLAFPDTMTGCSTSRIG